MTCLSKGGLAMSNLLEIEKLTISTTTDQILVDNSSFKIAQGEILGIVGESGSGKTLTGKALINALPNGLKMHYHRYHFLGHNMQQLTEEEKTKIIGQEVGFVPQNTGAFLHPLLKIKNQIIDAYCYHRKQRKQQGFQRAEEMLAAVGLPNPLRIMNSYPWELSGGMKQRVNIAMAMMLDPKLLIADEPTTALDCVTQNQVISLLQKINQEKNISIIFISHDLRLVNYLAQNTLVMSRGKIVEEGLTNTIFNHPQHEYTNSLIKSIPQIPS